jgi:hypothetical protein
VCVGNPKPHETVVSQFDLIAAFRTYFEKEEVPMVSGIALGVDTFRSGDGEKPLRIFTALNFWSELFGQVVWRAALGIKPAAARSSRLSGGSKSMAWRVLTITSPPLAHPERPKESLRQRACQAIFATDREADKRVS